MKALQVYTGKLLEEQVRMLNLGAGSALRWRVQQTGDDPNQLALHAEYKFKTFAKTWKFLNSIVIPAHTLKHHPLITTVYNQVKLELTTHDKGNQITSLDFKLAELINQSYNSEFAATKSEKEKSVSLSEASKIINELVSRKE